MSFLNSLLNEISGTTAPTASPAPSPAPRLRPREERPTVKREPNAHHDASVKKEVANPKETPITNGRSTDGPLPKRKADGELNEARQKLVKQEGAGGKNSRQATASVTPPATGQPYRGTAGLDRSRMSTKTVKPLSSGAHRTAPSSSPAARPLLKPAISSGQQSTTAPQATPKKGSYADMMARAAAAQKDVYKGIKHKPTGKPKNAGKSARPGTDQKSKLDPRERDKKRPPGSREPLSGGESEKNAEKRRKHTELAYKGTMRGAPKPTAYKGTMGIKRPEADRKRLEERRRDLAGRDRRYSYYDEYEDEEVEEQEEEQGYDEESDLSDMEANVFDVDQEEMQATKIAREEDKREQELEARLKREKQARLMKKMEQDAIARRERRRLNGI